jgi:4-hydroxy-2-oxoheptanedioate aldolase
MIPLHQKGLPVFGISPPSIGRGGGGGRGRGAQAGAVAGDSAARAVTQAAAPASPAAPAAPAAPVLADVAKETVGYKLADYLFTSGASDAFLQYVEEIRKAGGSASTHPFVSTIPIWHSNPQGATLAIHRQLNAGHVGVMMQAVESAAEVRETIKAMRFASAGGTRPDSGYELAAAYWGLTREQYKQKADVWPLNPNGELLVWAIVESIEGVAKVREIAAEPGVGVVWVGWGTLNGVYRDQPGGRDAAAKQVLAACKEFKKPCGFPTDNAADIEQRMGEGWNVFVMQARNAAGFGAVEAGRKLGGR